eukprot:CAMPEP_0119305162 /NCGR_PEP_ID=MMETSP1333-20130426/6223_1 /TAXON_ID=418940 /ORGANISM="Scyphosphaera apsteinii, Strain RCC1455" /LENGTH=1076 /DNA_ID=CAMNT_0007308185 /DNA_START=71 /DNA_END=3301 /DNA_ORIENTATION=+
MDAFDDCLFDAFTNSDHVVKREHAPNAARAKRARLEPPPFVPPPVPVSTPKSSQNGAETGGAPSMSEDANKAEEKPTGKACKHEIAVPPNFEADDLEGMLNLTHDEREPARKYTFELDPFQKAAVSCIEREESVLVSAHTSAGKTVCAEYAIAVCLRDKQRVIYTSPIKALSNQKYRELYETFGDVGLMTGDYTINVDASCLVMTTEILRSMLYRGSEVMREVKWVIFDEVHYMRDKERGVVWEEVMILLPHSVRYVFLSATVPNAYQFAEWIAQLHRQPCHVVYTEYRPTPLQHYLFGAGSDGFHMVVDENSTFRSAAFDKAATSIRPSSSRQANGKGGGKGSKGGKGGKGDRQAQGPSDIFKLVRTVVSLGMEPLIVFAFGKKAVEGLVGQMASLELTSLDERNMVTQIFQNAVDTLSEDDKLLPQVEQMLPMLQRGIAIHHSGLLPLLKELVEILFQENLVKLLFATETFAMGLNMPAKTVIFADLSKFDGTEFRILSSGEYIQMSGRAGRRGLDARGTVITMISEKSELAKVKEMLRGDADKLSSRFHLSYNMLLNCIRVETADIEHIIAQSFYTFQLQRSLPELEAKQQALAASLSSPEWRVPSEATVAELHSLICAEQVMRAEMRVVVNKPLHALPYLQPGRLARMIGPADDSARAAVNGEEVSWGWGVLVNFKRREWKAKAKTPKGAGKGDSDADNAGAAHEYVVDVMVRCQPGAENALAFGKTPTPAGDAEDAEMHVLSMGLLQVDALSSVKVTMPKDLKAVDGRFAVLKVVREVERRFTDGLPLLHPVEDMRNRDSNLPKQLRKLEGLQARLEEERLTDPEVRDALPLHRRKLLLLEEDKELRRQIKASRAALMREELKGMRRVLRRLGHVTEDGVITNKGRVACEVSTSDELLITELFFAGAFQALQPAQLASILSCLVAEQLSNKGGKSGGKGGKGTAAPNPLTLIASQSMRTPYEQLRELASRVATVVQEAKLPVNVEEYANRFSPALVDLVLEWCGGAKFADLCGMTDAYEGTIIRTMHRLEELLRQLIDAAKVVGNEDLQTKCEEARRLLVRDVVFAQSLYT